MRFSLVLCAPVMDCTLPSSSAAPRSPRRDEEQPDRWKYSQPWYHHSELSLSPGGQRCSNSRSEPLECRDLLVQNALFTGDLEMVQKYFTKNAAINLVIETKGDELRWTSRKRGGCAEMGGGGWGVPRMGREEQHRCLRKALRGTLRGGDREVEKELGKKGFWRRKEGSRADVEQVVTALWKVCRDSSAGKW